MIAENIQNIGENLKKACLKAGRNPDDVSLIAVSKTFGPEAVREAISSGLTVFGENYVQELIEKRNALADTQIDWHFIGHLQSNKVKYIADWITMIHSVDSVSLAAEIDKRGAKAGRKIKILIEVNTSEEATKYGVRPEEALTLIRTVSANRHIDLQGLMTIGPFTDDAEESRRSFRRLRNIFDEANRAGFLHKPLTVLSMGMTHDYPAAIEEGATMVRIGTAIFGTRTPQVN